MPGVPEGHRRVEASELVETAGSLNSRQLTDQFIRKVDELERDHQVHELRHIDSRKGKTRSCRPSRR